MFDTLGVGGAEQMALTFMEGVNKEKFNVVVCALFSRDKTIPEPIADEIRGLGIRVEQLSMTRWRDYKSISQFIKLIDEEDISIIHAHMRPADFWGCLLAKLFRGKIAIYTKHTTLPFPNKAYKIQHFFLNNFIADKIIAVSKAARRDLVENCFARQDNSKVIYNAINTNKFRPDIMGDDLKKELAISENEIIVGSSSRFDNYKGYDYFLEIAKNITATYKNVKFLAVGHGPLTSHLQKRIRELKLEEKVILNGPRRDMPQVLAAMDIFLFLSTRGEALSCAIAEAMSAGKAIVAANVGQAHELIETEISGLTPTPAIAADKVDTLDTTALTKAVERLIEDSELRTKFGRAARKRAETMFSAENFVKQTEDLYIELLNGQ